ncbi:ClbS/DfsB family four-helix bundle protein, partial [Escherichia coli]
MSVPQTKAELLLAIDKNFSKLISYLNTIPPEITSDKSMDGHAKGKRLVRTVLIFTESSDQLSRATDRVP